MFLLTKHESYPKQNRNKMIMILLMFYTWLKNFPNIKLIQTRNIFFYSICFLIIHPFYL